MCLVIEKLEISRWLVNVTSLEIIQQFWKHFLSLPVEDCLPSLSLLPPKFYEEVEDRFALQMCWKSLLREKHH